LVGSAVARELTRRSPGCRVYGIDCDMRGEFFGEAASTRRSVRRLKRELGDSYVHIDIDLRDEGCVREVVSSIPNLSGVVHAAAQPSHDKAVRIPTVDFDVNARATLLLLDAVRQVSTDIPLVYMSTNKVYGDAPNRLDYDVRHTRLTPSEWSVRGFRVGDLDVDRSMHSLFGVSKLAGDLYVQEYGRYFGMPTVCLRAGCLTGPGHAGVRLHGFLAYLVRSAVNCTPYVVEGYGGRQVRDNLHAADLAELVCTMLEVGVEPGSVYNVGGGLETSLSVLEAIDLVGSAVGRGVEYEVIDRVRMGDHAWWVTDNGPLVDVYGWAPRTPVDRTVEQMVGFERGAS